MKQRLLTAEQEAEAKRLEATIREAVDQEIASLARLLVSTSDQELFGQTEFQIRDLGSPQVIIYPELGCITRLHFGNSVDRCRRAAMGRKADFVRRTPVW